MKRIVKHCIVHGHMVYEGERYETTIEGPLAMSESIINMIQDEGYEVDKVEVKDKVIEA